ncbi:hypothetical protein WJX79_008664 [Trebouxia sp. C0005]
MLARCTMKVALITGCSSGLGKALARALHTGSWNAHSAAGFRVFATSRNTGDLQDLMLEGIDALQLDVTDADSVKSAVDHIEKEAGGIDLLVCNAGILRIGPIVEQDLSEYDRSHEAGNVPLQCEGYIHRGWHVSQQSHPQKYL